MKRPVLFTLLPALAIALLYLIFLGHRSDYAGHYMAGFGETLLAIMACADQPQTVGKELSYLP